jgi:hypothetical protein
MRAVEVVLTMEMAHLILVLLAAQAAVVKERQGQFL